MFWGFFNFIWIRHQHNDVLGNTCYKLRDWSKFMEAWDRCKMHGDKDFFLRLRVMGPQFFSVNEHGVSIFFAAAEMSFHENLSRHYFFSKNGTHTPPPPPPPHTHLLI